MTPQKTYRRQLTRRIGIFSMLALLVTCLAYRSETLALGEYLYDSLFNRNFHEVVHGRLYRSAGMSYPDLAETLRQKNIASVIDLRLSGDLPDADGMTEEKVVRGMGRDYFHLPLNSRRIPSYETMQKLHDAFEKLPEPILVHCSSGTYRSGVVSALFLMDHENVPVNQALEQLTIRYGYYRPARIVNARLRDRENLEDILFQYLAEGGEQKGPFLDWAKNRLDPKNETRTLIN